MNWLRSLPEFLIRCAEKIPCPYCDGELKVIGSRARGFIDDVGEKNTAHIRRLRCQGCSRVHHELPDFLVPYKRYSAECVEQILSSREESSTPADEATVNRWKRWVTENVTYWLGCLASIAVRYETGPVESPASSAQSAHQRLKQLVGVASGWLKRIVRPIVNANLWVHTRSA